MFPRLAVGARPGPFLGPEFVRFPLRDGATQRRHRRVRHNYPARLLGEQHVSFTDVNRAPRAARRLEPGNVSLTHSLAHSCYCCTSIDTGEQRTAAVSFFG